jgi:hypothetical protein
LCCCLFFCLLAIVLLSVLLSFGHCVVVCSSIYGFCLHLWYLQTFLRQAYTCWHLDGFHYFI